jgi:hypothetical protein
MSQQIVDLKLSQAQLGSSNAEIESLKQQLEDLESENMETVVSLKEE